MQFVGFVLLTAAVIMGALTLAGFLWEHSTEEKRQLAKRYKELGITGRRRKPGQTPATAPSRPSVRPSSRPRMSWEMVSAIGALLSGIAGILALFISAK